MTGQTISHYKILEKLGEGGMGIVYKAQDTKLDRIVALKFLPHALTAHEAERARFLQEAKAAAGLNHPHVCSVIDIHEENGQQFIVMEYVDGVTLRRKIDESRNAGRVGISPQDAVAYAIQIGEALAEAHAHGIVHRDIKSENIMVSLKNQIKVMDFGLAKLKGSLKLTRTSSTVGTLAYMAPEQIQGGEVDARSDIFSFGIVLFEMFTGKTPFRGEHDASMMYSILSEEPESLLKYSADLSPEFERIIKRSLEKDPEDRYQSIADMVSELRREQKKSGRVVQPVPSAGSIPVSAPSPPAGPAETHPALRRPGRAVWAAAAGAILIILAVAIYFFTGKRSAIESLAVLPFEDVGGGQDVEYLSDGITESIINNLTRLQGIRVVPRSTVFRFKGKDVDLQDIRSKLNVNAVLTGKIVHHGSALDVQVDLIDVDRESQLWGNHYQSDVSGILSLQEQITNDVSSNLSTSLAPAARKSIVKHYTDNAQAYQLYLQGRYYWNKRNAAAVEQAISYFRQAIALDSSYALAYAGLADCYIVQPQYAGVPTSIAMPLARAAAQQAIRLDDSLAEAHTSLAFCYYADWRYAEAEREFKLSLAINPRYATTYHWYGLMLGRAGHIKEYLSLLRQAEELDPYSPVIALNVGIANMWLGKPDVAMQELKKSTDLDPSFAVGYAWTAMLLEQQNNMQDAQPLLEKALTLSRRSSECVAYLGYYFARTGRTQEALRLLNENEQNYRERRGSAYNIAYIYAGLGDKEKVIEWLNVDLRDRGTWITAISTDKVWDDFRSDPRFVDLTRKIGLVQ